MRELSLNVMDVAQNSVRAQATLVFITVEDSDKNDSLTITIEDNGCGMTEEQVAQVIDPFFTTRTTRKVGLGVPLFKMSAEQTGGSFSIQSEVGRGTKTQASYVKSHVDMTPLGDINSTVSILIRCNPDIDFVFTHSFDNGSFTLDTRELREVLEGVSLDTPDVVEWIEQFLEEQTENICGGAEL
ncbi:MAG: sensor histidine kinase [Ruminococcus sp.]|nr:sensor histidine kinase [Ruminococcus sp.]